MDAGLRHGHPLSSPLYDVAGPAHEGHADLPSFPFAPVLPERLGWPVAEAPGMHPTGVAFVRGLNQTSHDTNGRRPCNTWCTGPVRRRRRGTPVPVQSW